MKFNGLFGLVGGEGGSGNGVRFGLGRNNFRKSLAIAKVNLTRLFGFV